MDHFVYILKCADGSLYTGYTVDIEKRIAEHNGQGEKSGAKYTRGRRPVELVYSEKFKTRSEAMKKEAAIKKLKRTEKQKLILS